MEHSDIEKLQIIPIRKQLVEKLLNKPKVSVCNTFEEEDFLKIENDFDAI
jgi:hypothetical protein